MTKIKQSLSFFLALLALSLPVSASVSYNVDYHSFYEGGSFGEWNDYNKPLASLSFQVDFSVPDADPSESRGLFPNAIHDVKFRERALHLNFTNTPSHLDVRTWGLDSFEKNSVAEGELNGNHYYYQTSIFFDLSGVDKHGQTFNFISNLEFYYACPSLGESLNDLKDPNCFPQHLSPGETRIWSQNTGSQYYSFNGTVGRVSTPESSPIPMLLVGLLGIAALRRKRSTS